MKSGRFYLTMIMMMLTTTLRSHGRRAGGYRSIGVVAAWIPPTLPTRTKSSTRRWVHVDEEGRRIRNKSPDNEWDYTQTESTTAATSGGWDDFDPTADLTTERRSSAKAPAARDRWRDDNRGFSDDSSNRRNDRSNQRSGRDQRRSSEPRSRDSQWSSYNNKSNNNKRRFDSAKNNKIADDRKINMNALEGAGFVHLYGLAPVLNALKSGKRDFTRPENLIDIEMLQGEELEHELRQRARKPEAQFTPWLFIQEQQSDTNSGRARDKKSQAIALTELAETRGIPTAYVDKGVLNTLSGNRPHQGYVLRCGKLFFESLSRLPLRSDVDDHDDDGSEKPPPNFWLVLDEVVDPQNLGALIRSAYFLGGSNVGLLVCTKNSAPPSAVVSAASAGALELVDVLYSTSNLPRTLALAEQDGFRIIGASSSIPTENDGAVLYELQDLPPASGTQPTVLVMGSEGHGLRNLVARSCTELVKIAGSDTVTEGVDSLNVSVSGGILMWHLLKSN